MKVLYDHQVFVAQDYGGISRYFYELMAHALEEQIDYHLSLLLSNNVHIPKIKAEVYPFLKGIDFRGKRSSAEAINRLNTLKDLFTKTYDIFHPTFYNDYFIDIIKGKKPVVVTCHDMIHERLRDLFINDPTAKYKERQIQAATCIIAVSENTKKDLIDILNVPESKIFVTPLASAFKLNPLLPKSNYVNSLGRFILFVGVRALYKNFLSYLEAISPLLLQNSLKLVCAGGNAFTKYEQIVIKKLGLTDCVIQKTVNDLLLQQLYTAAIAFAFPSKYEGFGIPVLEAFSLGCPTLLSNKGSLPEVGGNAAVYFDPYDQQSMYTVTKKLIENESDRLDLQKKALKRSAYFSWKKTAHNTFNIYKKVTN